MSMVALMCPAENSTSESYTRSLLDVEKNFDLCGSFRWLTANWTLCFYLMAVYMIAIFIGRKYMASRPPFQLRVAFIFWNIFLALYSTISAWRMITAITFTVRKHGFLASICGMDSLEHRQAVGLWMFLFAVSKIVEFGDTVFIILRKSELTFLHWYHHTSVAFFVWSTAVYASPMHSYYCTLNFSVHSIMYSYYALKLLKFRIPKTINVAITSLQLLQMAAGIFLTWYTFRAKAYDPTCFVGTEAIIIGASIYFTYFLLFLLFFTRSYVTKGKTKCVSNGTTKKLM